VPAALLVLGLVWPAGAALLVLGLVWPAGQLQAQDTIAPIISADDALRLAESGQIVLVDVRSPQEWRQTGVPSGARTVTIHNPNGLVGFLEAMEGALGADPDQAIAVIARQHRRARLAGPRAAHGRLQRLLMRL
jgi:rhodanese-related sulfurtransferase